ncbi:MAG TPA: DUF4097 family beta strand repeat-containing protein [Methylomirabilota bacterium]|nr:DUF4097 family beta strand repeat-containing protein [Methylomirabilota bacterium]
MRQFLFTALVLFCASAAAANECKFHEDRNLEIDATGLHALELKLGSSDLHAKGEAGLAKIEVRGRACASAQERLAGLTIEQQRVGDTITVTSHQADHQNFSLFGSDYAYIDLEVRLPQSLPLQVRATSGDANVKDVAALDFSSHSGDLIVDGIAGAVAVDVHSGDVKADDIGSLEVRHAGSGDVSARNVRGEVKVGHVGSGDLVFDDVTGGVHVESIGSGDITVDHAGGSVIVDSVGSGDISANNIGGDLVVKSAGSSDIHHRNIKGKIDIPRHSDDD